LLQVIFDGLQSLHQLCQVWEDAGFWHLGQLVLHYGPTLCKINPSHYISWYYHVAGKHSTASSIKMYSDGVHIFYKCFLLGEWDG